MAEEEELQEEQPEEEADNELRAVPSSMVAEIGWEDGELTVIFVNGHENQYPITEDQWKELKEAPSVGQWMHQNVLNN